MSTAKHSLSRIARVMLSGAALAALATLSAGCSTTATSDVNPSDYDYRLRHPILVSEEPEVMNMPVGMRGPAISPEIETAIREYAGEYRADGTGSITIQVPMGSANEVAAASTGRAVHYALVRSGVSRGHIQVAPYEVGDHAKIAPLRLAYLRVKAVVPRCGIWPDANQGSYLNKDYHNFGCAQQQNLAAMVANPADFMKPRPMGPADGYRRADIISKYRRGEDPQTNIMLIESGIGG
jgi:pilus assembly protein CpaD